MPITRSCWSPDRPSSSTPTASSSAARVPLQDGFDWLVDLLDGLQDLDAETICDRILADVDKTVDDDIVLLVLRAV